MAQAKTFTAEEFDALLDFVSKRSYAMRNRMMILISFWSGMRVGEIASLRIEDVVDTAGKVKREIRLDAAQTKGRHARTVFFPEKLVSELQVYVDARAVKDRKQPFFMTAGGKAFSANANRHLQDAYFEHDNIRNHLTVIQRRLRKIGNTSLQ